MRIGFLGNANNYPFMLARAIRRKGHDVLFLVDRVEKLNRPENRYSDISQPYPKWICDVSPLNLTRIRTFRSRIRVISMLKSCDAVVLNEHGLCLAPAISRPTIALLTGTDLEVLADFSLIERSLRGCSNDLRGRVLRPLRKRFIRHLIASQREAIRTAVAVNYFAKGMVPKGDAMLEDIAVDDARRTFFMMTDVCLIKYQPPPQNAKVRLFCVARLTWKKTDGLEGISELDLKGSDVMIQGLSLFLKASRTPLEIRLPRKGLHIRETMQLIEREGIADSVTWVDEMTQEQVLAEYRHADIVFDQLAESVVGMGGLDAMACGRPLIANGRPDILERELGVRSPICQASTPKEVCQQLERLVPDPAERRRVGLESRKYVEQYFSADHAATVCIQRLAAT